MFDSLDGLCYTSYRTYILLRGENMADALSEKQQRILDFIRNEQLNKGYPPSVREICEAVGLKSTSTVHGHLERLEKKGLLDGTLQSQEQLK